MEPKGIQFNKLITLTMAEKKQKPVTYVSKYLALRIVLKSSYNNEVGGRVVTHPGQSVRFVEGAYITEDPAIIASLEARPEFGSIFIRVPDDTEAMAHREDWQKDLETRQKELDQKEKDLAEREARINATEEGGRSASAGEVSDDLVDLGRPALIEVAKSEGVDPSAWKPGTTNDSLIEAIRAKRTEGAGEEGPEAGPEEEGAAKY